MFIEFAKSKSVALAFNNKAVLCVLSASVVNPLPYPVSGFQSPFIVVDP